MYSSAGWATLNHCIAPIVAPSPRKYATSEVEKNGLSNAGNRRRSCGCRACFAASGDRDLWTRAPHPDPGQNKRTGQGGERERGRGVPVIPQAQPAPEPWNDDIPPAEESEPVRVVQEKVFGFWEENFDRCVDGRCD